MAGNLPDALFCRFETGCRAVCGNGVAASLHLVQEVFQRVGIVILGSGGKLHFPLRQLAQESPGNHGQQVQPACGFFESGNVYLLVHENEDERQRWGRMIVLARPSAVLAKHLDMGIQKAFESFHIDRFVEEKYMRWQSTPLPDFLFTHA